MSKILIIAALALAWTLSCAKQDPFDQSFIEKDLRKQTAQEIHDAADKFAYEPPADGKLTEAQIANYTKVVKLGDRIRATAERYAGSHGPRLCCIRISTRRRSSGGIRRRARVRDRRAPRLPELGLNPKEHEWVGQRIDGALSMIDQLARRENDVATKLAASDNEIDAVLRTTKRHAFERAADEKQRWENDQDPDALANAELVRQHKHERVPSL